MLQKNKIKAACVLVFVFILMILFLTSCKKVEVKEDLKIGEKEELEKKEEISCTEKLLFKEDFSSEINLLFIDLSEVGVSDYNIVTLDNNKALELTLRGVRIKTDALLTKQSYENFNLSFKIHDVKPYSMIPAFIVGFDSDGYYLIVYDDYGNIKLYSMPEERKLFEKKNYRIQDGRWHLINIVMDSTKIIFYVDSIEIFDYDIGKEKGRIGFANGDGSLGKYLLDDIKIRTLC